jgi:hypothetical protein
MLLDSGQTHCERGRYDIIVAEPTATLAVWGRLTEVRWGNQLRLICEDPFAQLRRMLGPSIAGQRQGPR